MMKRNLWLGVVIALFAVGCVKKKPPEPPKVFNPEANSGPDYKRTGALPIPPNIKVSDVVNFKEGDQTDWKSVELEGESGILQVEVAWTTTASDLMVDVFDTFGIQIGASPPASVAPEKKLAVPIDKPGTYYIRIRAPRETDGSGYTVLASWNAPPPVAQVEKRPTRTRHRARRESRPRGGSSVQGRIVASYRSGGGRVLHIDKGSAAGVDVGQSGTILEGASGSSDLDGGSFKIIEVVGKNKSIGKTSLSSIGRNTRVSIRTGR